MDLARYQGEQDRFVHLSLHDLLEARDLYHPYLMQHPNVVATAIGRYRIRVDDTWPNHTGPERHGHGARTLANSEVRAYSWPAILVFVKEWVEPERFTGTGRGAASRRDHHRYDSTDRVPPSLFLPDGREVPVCVIEAPRVAESAPSGAPPRQPSNNLGSGTPLVVDLQGQSHFATVTGIVSDGHTAFALTNRHVAGEAGEVISAIADDRATPIGVTAERHLTRLPFSELYPAWPGRETYVNLDVGMIRVDDVNRWTTRVPGAGVVGPMADLSTNNLSLNLIGCDVRGYGAGSGPMEAEIAAFFYRYKSQGGFEYVADLFLGPRSEGGSRPRRSSAEPLVTRPGDSGTLWLLEPLASGGTPGRAEEPKAEDLLPLCIQWGEQRFARPDAEPQAYALATLLSSVCNLLEVDFVRDWNLDQPNTWGAVGHFSIGANGAGALSSRVPKLRDLMTRNAEVISYLPAKIETADFQSMSMTKAAIVPMVDIPDYYWKHGQQGYRRGAEGPDHFADMDQPGPDGKTLLDLCKDPANVDPTVWATFYASLPPDPLDPKHQAMGAMDMGMLPFRVWQIFDAMVRFARAGNALDFVCAAGVLGHYVGDACQPLHVSYLFNGDPARPHDRHFTEHRVAKVEQVGFGWGVHSAYEDAMVSRDKSRPLILATLAATPTVAATELLPDGHAAAVALVELMRTTIEHLDPMTIVNLFGNYTGDDVAGFLWSKLGTKTRNAMRNGTHLLAVLWESAWVLGDGEANVTPITIPATSADPKVDPPAMARCQDATFLPSVTIKNVGPLLTP